MLTEHRMAELLDECNQLCNMIGQSIVTAKEGKEKKRYDWNAVEQFAFFNFHFSMVWRKQDRNSRNDAIAV